MIPDWLPYAWLALCSLVMFTANPIVVRFDRYRERTNPHRLLAEVQDDRDFDGNVAARWVG